MKTHFISVILIIALLCACLPQLSLPASAADSSGVCGDNLAWSFQSDTGTLTVTGSGAMTSWSMPSEVPWNSFRDSIRALELSKDLTNISGYAFYDCNNLAGVTIPDKVLSIGRNAFEQCDALTTAIIGSGVKSIGEGVFRNCKRLASVVVAANKFGFDNNSSTTLGDPSLTTIYAAQNSTAANYAKDFGYKLIVDVQPSAYYTSSVIWAAENGITSGLDKNHFGPGSTCTRGQVVTFLWRSKGSPAPRNTYNPFSDVKQGAYYYDAVLWAVENDITSGTGNSTFSPNKGCTRGQVVTFLWRAKGSPSPKSTSNPFSDVKESAFFYSAVLWAIEKEITSGVSKTSFAPNKTCTRGQIVTFLYRSWSAVPDTFTIIFDATGGSVSTDSLTVNKGSAPGTLPEPKRDFYSFNGWFTEKTGGTKVTQDTVLSVDSSIVVYAQWTLHPLSGWVLVSEVPSDARVENRKWNYTKTTTVESTDANLSGYTLVDSRWVQSAQSSFNYASFPGGFDSNNWYYQNWNRGAYSAYETATEKREVSTGRAGYIYWHWMYDTANANGTSGRAIYNQYGWGPTNGYLYKYFGAFASATNYQYGGTDYCNNLGMANYIVGDRTSWNDCQGATRWFRFDYYTCWYTDYYKVFQYQKSEDLESETQVTAGTNGNETISNVQEMVRYREK